MKWWPGGSHFVVKGTPRVPGYITCMDIGYNYNSRMVLVFVSTEGSASTDPGDTHLSFSLKIIIIFLLALLLVLSDIALKK